MSNSEDRPYFGLEGDIKCLFCTYHSGGSGGGIEMALDTMRHHVQVKHPEEFEKRGIEIIPLKKSS